MEVHRWVVGVWVRVGRPEPQVFWAPSRSPLYRQRMTDEARNQVGISVRQLNAILEAADQADSDSVLLRTQRGGTDPAPVEVWLFSEEAEGIVGMIEVDPTGVVTELDE